MARDSRVTAELRLLSAWLARIAEHDPGLTTGPHGKKNHLE